MQIKSLSNWSTNFVKCKQNLQRISNDNIQSKNDVSDPLPFTSWFFWWKSAKPRQHLLIYFQLIHDFKLFLNHQVSTFGARAQMNCFVREIQIYRQSKWIYYSGLFWNGKMCFIINSKENTEKETITSIYAETYVNYCW